MGGAAILGLALLWLVQPARAEMIQFQLFSETHAGGAFVDGFSIAENSSHPSYYVISEFAGGSAAANLVGAYDTFTGVMSSGWNTNSNVNISSFSNNGGSLFTFKATIDGYLIKWTATSNQDASVSPGGVSNGIVIVGGSTTPNGSTAQTFYNFNMSDTPFATPVGPPLSLTGTVFGNLGAGGANSISMGDQFSISGNAFYGSPAANHLTGAATVTHTMSTATTNILPINPGGSYTLGVLGDLELAGTGSSFFDAQAVTVVPETVVPEPDGSPWWTCSRTWCASVRKNWTRSKRKSTPAP
jgi:hypothetical protein